MNSLKENKKHNQFMMVMLGMTYEGIEKSVPAPIYFSEVHRTLAMVYLWNISREINGMAFFSGLRKV